MSAANPARVSDLGPFRPLKAVKVDERGRFYLPNKVVETLFNNTAPHDREVFVFLGPGGRVLLIPDTQVGIPKVD